MPRRRGARIAPLAAGLALSAGLASCAGDDDAAPAPGTTISVAAIAERPVPELAADLGSEDATRRLLAAEGLRRAGTGAARHVPALLERLASDPDPGVRRSAAGAIGELAAPREEVVSALLDALGDDASGVRAWSAAALARLGAATEPVRLALRALESDPSWDVRRAARAALDTLEGQPAPRIPSAGPPDDLPERLEALGYDPEADSRPAHPPTD